MFCVNTKVHQYTDTLEMPAMVVRVDWKVCCELNSWMTVVKGVDGKLAIALRRGTVGEHGRGNCVTINDELCCSRL